MKKLQTLIALISMCFYITSCKECPECKECSDNPEYIKKEISLAKAEKFNDIYVFIKSEPACDFEVLGPVKNDFTEQVKDNTKGKKLGKIIKGVFDVTKDNVDFNTLLNNMVERAKNQYSNVNAVIFKDNLSKCQAVKFK